MARSTKQAAIARTTNSDGWKFFEEYLKDRVESLQRDILKDDVNVDKIRGQITELVEVLNWAEERKQYKI